MNLTKLQIQKLRLLKETKDYYSIDPSNRRCAIDDDCYYSPDTVGKEKTSQGCAIGRLLNKDLKKYLDYNFGLCGISNDVLFIELPEWLQEYDKEFLKHLQNFHDFNIYWSDKGLTEEGDSHYNYMRDKIINGDI